MIRNYFVLGVQKGVLGGLKKPYKFTPIDYSDRLLLSVEKAINDTRNLINLFKE